MLSKMLPKYFLSVIICCFNKEKTLKITLDSLIKQTLFKKMEIICVDDNSTDNSLNILKEYAIKYDNFKIYHLTNNSSVYIARKIGIEKSTAPYITFMDPDDWADSDFYLELIKEITRTKADIIMSPSVYRWYSEDNIKCVKDVLYKEYKENKVINVVDEYNIKKTCMTLWNRIFKRNIIEKVLECKNSYINYIEDNLIYIISVINSKTLCYYETKSFYYYNYSDESDHLSKCNGNIIKCAKYVELTFEIINEYLNNHQNLKNIFDNQIKEYKLKYTKGIYVNIYNTLIKSKGYKMFFTPDNKLVDNYKELLMHEENKKSFDLISKIINLLNYYKKDIDITY